MRNALKLIVLLSLLPASSLFAQAEAPPAKPATIDLRPKFKEGASAKYSIWSLRKQVATLSFAGKERTAETSLETEGEVQWEVERINADGSAECTMTLLWLKATAIGEGKTLVNDSRQGTGDTAAFHQLLQAIAKAPLTVTVAANGSIQKVEGINAIKARVDNEKVVPDELDFKETANDLALISSAIAGAKVSSSWEDDAAWNHELGKLQYKTRYEVQGVEQIAGISVATVSGKSRILLDVDQSKFPPGVTPDIKLTEGEATSQVMFDLTRREAIGRHSKQTTVIEVNIPIRDQTMKRIEEQTIQSQALRIEEK